ncbi:hypothetical protein ACOSP7_024236 [Xanthoceras sorbifolium]
MQLDLKFIEEFLELLGGSVVSGSSSKVEGVSSVSGVSSLSLVALGSGAPAASGSRGSVASKGSAASVALGGLSARVAEPTAGVSSGVLGRASSFFGRLYCGPWRLVGW